MRHLQDLRLFVDDRAARIFPPLHLIGGDSGTEHARESHGIFEGGSFGAGIGLRPATAGRFPSKELGTSSLLLSSAPTSMPSTTM